MNDKKTEEDENETINIKRGETSGAIRVKLEDYSLGRIIGRGAFGKIYFAKNKKTNKPVAVKLIKKDEVIRSKQIDHLYNENHVISQLNHPFMVSYVGLAQDSRNMYLIMELVNGGPLSSYLQDIDYFLTNEACFYASIVVLALEFLHSKNIVYRDLKPENLIIGIDGYLKLVDFGFAKELTKPRTYTLCGTPEYMSPQIIKNRGHGKSVDWWSLGVLIYELQTGISPFCHEDPMNIYKNILRGKVVFPSFFDQDSKSLVCHLLDPDCTKRYGNGRRAVKQIKKHRWFNNHISFDKLQRKKVKPPLIPSVKNYADISNFLQYPDSGLVTPCIRPNVDPFYNW